MKYDHVVGKCLALVSGVSAQLTHREHILFCFYSGVRNHHQERRCPLISNTQAHAHKHEQETKGRTVPAHSISVYNVLYIILYSSKGLLRAFHFLHTKLTQHVRKRLQLYLPLKPTRVAVGRDGGQSFRFP